MDIVHLVIVLAVLGFAGYILFTYVPMVAPIKQLIIAVIAVACVILLLQFAGYGGGLSLIHR